MKQYKISIEDREYREWELFDATTHESATIENFVPQHHKLFHGDVFEYNDSNDDRDVHIVHSILRSSVQFPAVLLLNSSIYGKRKNKFIYKCIPDNKHLPIFLVAYEQKNIGFSKNKINRYVTLQFLKWDDTHPEAIIKNNIGDVNELNHFYEYQLFCKSLNASIQGFTKDAKRSIQRISSKATIDSIIETQNIPQRSEASIFSIDGVGTQDFDDAFSIKQNGDEFILSIYITNVAVWMDTLNIWDSFSQRISSIYLPDRKRPMLPTILTNVLCSLYAGERRIALAMDIKVCNNGNVDVNYENVAIRVEKNYTYDEMDEHSTKDYNLLRKCVARMSQTCNLMKNIDTSKDVVAYLMMFMNYYTSKVFISHKCGVFRSLHMNSDTIPDEVPNELYKFVKIWNSSSGQYTMNFNEQHDILDINSYIHITSPMRRLVDLLNIIEIQRVLNLYSFSNNAKEFYDNWVGRLEYINTTMRSIRKIQLDCNLLHWCNDQVDLSSRKYDGYVFDKFQRSDGLFHYIVYIQSIKMASRITVRHDLKNYSKHHFTLHIFDKKDSFKKKVRLHLHYSDCEEA